MLGQASLIPVLSPRDREVRGGRAGHHLGNVGGLGKVEGLGENKGGKWGRGTFPSTK